ncbi:MAG: TM2 domain-containing protein [Bacteroidota bacterium]
MNKNTLSTAFLALLIALSTRISAKSDNLLSKPDSNLISVMVYLAGDSAFNNILTDTLTLQLKQEGSLLPAKQPNDKKEKIKWITKVLAFPFPFGFVGAHRVMLGTKPWVPVVYVATFGGCFGILPLIDFCVIMFSDNIEQYENNPNIFMWIK